MDEKKAMEVVYSILEKNEGSTEAEIAYKWQEPPVRPSEKRTLVGDALIELIQNGRVFFSCEKPSVKTLVYGQTPYRYFTDKKKSKHEMTD